MAGYLPVAVHDHRERGRLHAADDLDPLLERNGWMLVIRDWWFTDEPFGRAE